MKVLKSMINITGKMFYKIFLVLAVFVCSANSQTTSTINYPLGTSLNIGTGSDVCADEININGTYTGGGTICNGALPVTLQFFYGKIEGENSVELEWSTSQEVNNSGFQVERLQVNTTNSGEWSLMEFIPGAGTVNEPRYYSFTDSRLQKGSFRYRLKQIDFNANFEYYLLDQEFEISAPKKFNLAQSYPNPSNPASIINFNIPENAFVTLKIYNIAGEEVLTLVNDHKEAGFYEEEFNGSALASGVYFYRLISKGEKNTFSKTMKLVLVK